MRILHAMTAAAIALPLSLTAAFANDVEGISRAVQQQTFVACARRLGVNGTINLQAINAASPLFLANGNGISLRQARAVNRCATNTYAAIRAGGQVPAQAAPRRVRHTQGVPADTYRGGKAGQGGGDRVTFSDYQCPPNFSGMFRGTLYCADGVLMR